jgi:hypothetical protein
VVAEPITFHGIEESDMSEMTPLSEVFPAHDPKVVTNPISGRILAAVSSPNSELVPKAATIDGEPISGIPTLHRTESRGVSEAATRQQLTRMLQSPIFVHSERLSRFLRFIVEHVIGGNQNCLKEYVIGSEVYDRRPPYNPTQDSIVRTEARRLRGKLKEYYETVGKDDPIFVYLRPGSYVPVLRHKEALVGSQRGAHIHDHLLSEPREGLRYPSARISQLELLVEELMVKNQQLRFSLNQIVGLVSAESPAVLNYCSARRRSNTQT